MKSLCRGCGRTFGGMTGFERHRAGEYEMSPPKYGRRCLGDDELADIGLSPDPNGVWRFAAPSINPYSKEIGRGN